MTVYLDTESTGLSRAKGDVIFELAIVDPAHPTNTQRLQ